ncbi:MAG: RNA polymerase sigma factor SigM [Nocardioides sp.]|uniref:RNA polymerase sigma factor SigM n=1 Tax=Nocardioides sp. TaxID=35761 RepID=UPI0039E31105
MTTEEASDTALLAAHVDGDPDAFGVLFARHRDRLWAVAVRTMGNPEDAADGLQDGLIAAYRRASSYRGEAAVTTWLHRVVVNACLDRLRAARVRAAQALPDDLDEVATHGSLITADLDHDPADAVVATERRELLLAALAELPAEQRIALVLVDMEGHSVAEAAQMLGCAEGTVKSRCSRGRTRLATRLGMLRPGAPSADTAGNPAVAPTVPPSGPSLRGPSPPPEPTRGGAP